MTDWLILNCSCGQFVHESADSATSLAERDCIRSFKIVAELDSRRVSIGKHFLEYVVNVVCCNYMRLMMACDRDLSINFSFLMLFYC